MSVAFDTQTYVDHTGNTAWNQAHTCTGSDLYLLVAIACSASNSGVTYNSVAMGLLGSFTFVNLVSMRFEVWGLVAPASGAHNVTITPTGAPEDFRVSITSWTGVHQSTPPTVVSDDHDAQDGSSTSVNLTSGTADDMSVDFICTYSRAVSPGASQTALTGSGSAIPTLAGSYWAGAHTMTESFSGNQIRSAKGILLPAAGGPPAGNNGGMFF